MHKYEDPDFWQRPNPERYYNASPTRAALVVKALAGVNREQPVLEIGCNSGRNLLGLEAAGFTDLTGVDVSQRAVGYFYERHPESGIVMHCAAAEDWLPGVMFGSYAAIFTMAVLMHIPPEKINLVLDGIAMTAASRVVLIEAEKAKIEGHIYPREYRPLMEARGWTQRESFRAINVCDLPAYMVRIFQRRGNGNKDQAPRD